MNKGELLKKYTVVLFPFQEATLPSSSFQDTVQSSHIFVLCFVSNKLKAQVLTKQLEAETIAHARQVFMKILFSFVFPFFKEWIFILFIYLLATLLNVGS